MAWTIRCRRPGVEAAKCRFFKLRRSTIRLSDQSRPMRSSTTRMIADDTDAAVTEAVAVAAEAATKAAKQEDDEDGDEYESKRYDLSPVAAPNRTLSLFALRL
jgi:hypothetical protein